MFKCWLVIVGTGRTAGHTLELFVLDIEGWKPYDILNHTSIILWVINGSVQYLHMKKKALVKELYEIDTFSSNLMEHKIYSS